MEKKIIVRVELEVVDRGALDQAYALLDAEMGMRGFERVLSVGGRYKKLPSGTFVGRVADVGGSRDAAMRRVKEAVDRTQCSSSAYVVIVTEEGLRTEGLRDIV